MILHQAVPPDAPPDEQDVLEQVGAVEAALIDAGWRTRRVAAELDLAAALRALEADPPDLVVNLVESLAVARGRGPLASGLMAPPTSGSMSGSSQEPLMCSGISSPRRSRSPPCPERLATSFGRTV